MIMAIYLYIFFNLFAWLELCPFWVRTICFIAQFICVTIAATIWEYHKDRIKVLEEKLREKDDEDL